MTFLFFADAHLKDGQPYGDDRLADQERVLDQLVDVAREHDVDGVLFGGDLFHFWKPTPRELHVARDFFSKLAAASIPTVAITGNAPHDIGAADLPCALELFASEWVHVSRYPELVKAAGDVAVCTLPNVPVARLVAKQGGRDEISELATALLLETAAELRSQVPDGWPAILLAHWSISGASLPNGLPVSDLHEPVLPLDALEALDFDAVLAGHIHRAGPFGTMGFRPVLYGGSPLCLNFGEQSVDHGCWLVAPDQFGWGATFVPLTDRRFVTVDVDLTSATFAEHAAGVDETDLVAAAIVEQYQENSLADAVVRIRYRATEEQHRRVDVAALKGFCMEAGAHRVYQVLPELVRVTRLRSAGVDESLEPGAALDLWAAANDLEETDRRRTRDLLTSYLEAAA
jgi:exonuclease SbcD